MRFMKSPLVRAFPPTADAEEVVAVVAGVIADGMFHL